MKKLILLLFFITGASLAQPNINQPSDLYFCDDGYDDRGYFDLTTKTSEILNGLDASAHSIAFYETELDAQNDTNRISDTLNYFNTVNFQVIHVRVWENADVNSFALTNFRLIVVRPLRLDVMPALHVYEDPYDGFSTFDLTEHEDLNSALSLTYFESLDDAQNNVNQIPNPTAYNNLSFRQTIHVRGEYVPAGCFAFSYFQIVVVDPNDILNIPDANFKAAIIADNVDKNGDSEIQVNEVLGVTTLRVQSSNIIDLSGVEAFYDLDYLRCSDNMLTSIDVTQNVNLRHLWCSDNQLTSLDVTQNTELLEMFIWNNLLTTIDVSQNTKLGEFQCYDNQLTSLDVSQNLDLVFLVCYNNQLTTLNINDNINLYRLACHSNQLTTLFIKNGINEAELIFGNNPNLGFICADEGQVGSVQGNAAATTVVSSYCTFTPGGNYNTITGAIIYDLDNNGCDATDIPQPNIRVDINDGTNLGAAFSNSLGDYAFYTDAGSFDITPNLENPSWFSVSPTTVNIPFTDNNNNFASQDFCIIANGVHNDVEIVIAPIDLARPGFDASYQIVYKNKGNQVLSGDFEYTFNDDVLDFVSATTTPNAQTTGSLSWNYSNLLPFEDRSVYVTFHVNSPTDVPAVNIGDQLNFNATINPSVGDETPLDNAFEYNQIVVGSYDPNNIICIEGDIVPVTAIGEYLHYIVNFENTGTAPAENVVVTMEINPTQFDINSLYVLNTSDDVEVRITNDFIEFIFQGMYLDTGGHGNILLKIKTKEDLVENDIVSENANIHFDYNFPIETNNADTTFESLSIEEYEIDESISIFPNPFNDTLNVNAKSTIQSIEIYDVQGRLIQTKLMRENNIMINTSSFSKGVYFLKIKTDVGAIVEKLIKN